jgi:menaquinone-dependent protoporphyrinogen IX oxidase
MHLSRRTVLTSMVAAATLPKWSFAAEEQRVLVAYYSYTGHTGAVADKIRALLGAELFEIQMLHPYPLDMQRVAELSKYELETGELPPLFDDLPDLTKYDLILVGGACVVEHHHATRYEFPRAHGLQGAKGRAFRDLCAGASAL